jgi:hypothetical protein
VIPSPEVCDGLDNDCNGIADGLALTCYEGSSGTAGVGACLAGTRTCTGGAWGACAGQVLPSGEACDGADNDCDGTPDEGLSQACYSGPQGTQGVGLCKAGVAACANGTWGYCGGEVIPLPESCDGSDNDCNGDVDDVPWPAADSCEPNDDLNSCWNLGEVKNVGVVYSMSGRTFHTSGDSDFFYWSYQGNLCCSYYWMCRAVGLPSTARVKIWLGLDGKGLPLTWDKVNQTSGEVAPGTVVSADVSDSTLWPYALGVGVTASQGMTSCASTYTVECKLSATPSW